MWSESLQVLAGTVSSFFVGMVWYSSILFGPTWWSYQFPNKKYGTTNGNCWYLLALTVMVLVLQSIVLTFIVNTLLYHITPFCNIGYPLAISLTLCLLNAVVSAPHYFYAGKPLGLYFICAGHDSVQVSFAVFTIYLLAGSSC